MLQALLCQKAAVASCLPTVGSARNEQAHDAPALATEHVPSRARAPLSLGTRCATAARATPVFSFAPMSGSRTRRRRPPVLADTQTCASPTTGGGRPRRRNHRRAPRHRERQGDASIAVAQPRAYARPGRRPTRRWSSWLLPPLDFSRRPAPQRDDSFRQRSITRRRRPRRSLCFCRWRARRYRNGATKGLSGSGQRTP